MNYIMSTLDVPEKVDKVLLRDLLSSGWLRHDAMWFYYCSKEVGIERTNKLNKAAIKDMAKYEGQKLMAALGYRDKKPQTFEEFKALFIQMFGVVKASFMKGTLEFIEQNKLRFTWQDCFAYSGVARLGLIEHYECGIFERINVWLDVIGVEWEVTPQITNCMMHEQGICFRDYTLYF